MVINHHLIKDVGYDPDKDFEPVALVAVVPLAVVVPAAAPYSSVRELLAAARAEKRGLTFTSGGPGTTGHLAGELLHLRTPARLVHVPSEGAAKAINEVLEAFRESSGNSGRRMRQGAETASLSEVASAAHQLKSAARSIGALRLGDLCADIERHVLTGDADTLNDLLTRFQFEMSAVNDFLDSR